jgi:hypothetical protein
MHVSFYYISASCCIQILFTLNFTVFNATYLKYFSPQKIFNELRVRGIQKCVGDHVKCLLLPGFNQYWNMLTKVKLSNVRFFKNLMKIS